MIKLLSRITHLLGVMSIAVFGLAATAVAQVSNHPAAVTVYTFTPKRMAASSAAVIALIAAVIGGLALRRSIRRIGSGGRRGAIVALLMAPIGIVIGALVVATANGGLGTGNGLAGGVVAIAIGLIGMTLGGLALARSRRLTDAVRTPQLRDRHVESGRIV